MERVGVLRATARGRDIGRFYVVEVFKCDGDMAQVGEGGAVAVAYLPNTLIRLHLRPEDRVEVLSIRPIFGHQRLPLVDEELGAGLLTGVVVP